MFCINKQAINKRKDMTKYDKAYFWNRHFAQKEMSRKTLLPVGVNCVLS